MINNVVVNNFQTTVLDVQLLPEFIPVELISFTANAIGSDVELEWQTATETNNMGFSVERSKMSKHNGQMDWESIGFVQGSGTTTEQRIYLFTDENVSPGNYQYRLKQIDFDGSYTFSNIIEVEVNIPYEFALEQNYPNPFNPSTKIKYSIPLVGTRDRVSVLLKVYDVLGNEIATLVNEEKSPGNYDVDFDGTGLTSGIYFYKLQAGNFIQTKKMIFMK